MSNNSLSCKATKFKMRPKHKWLAGGLVFFDCFRLSSTAAMAIKRGVEAHSPRMKPTKTRACKIIDEIKRDEMHFQNLSTPSFRVQTAAAIPNTQTRWWQIMPNRLRDDVKHPSTTTAGCLLSQTIPTKSRIASRQKYAIDTLKTQIWRGDVSSSKYFYESSRLQ